MFMHGTTRSVIRYSTPSPPSELGETFIREIISEEFHWLIVTTFERDTASTMTSFVFPSIIEGGCTQEYALERTQAFKLMSKTLALAPHAFPLSFARSVVAVANFKDDSFRKVYHLPALSSGRCNCLAVAVLHLPAARTGPLQSPIGRQCDRLQHAH